MQTTANPPQTPDEEDALWAEVAERLAAFAQAWDNMPEPPDLVGFVPHGPIKLRRLVLVELVKYDIDRRIRAGLPSKIENYVERFPELGKDGGPPCDLLYEDFHLRRQAGHTVHSGDYSHRFPGRAVEFAKLIAGSTVPSRASSAGGSRAPTCLNAGDQIDDFDLLAKLGEGQFANVFLARQRSMQRMVALKISELRGAEAQTLARLDHPHIVRVYDQRSLPQRGLLLVYMPYLAGGTLLDVVRHAKGIPATGRSGRTLLESVDAALDRRGELSPGETTVRMRWAARSWPATVCAIGAKLARALAYSHGQGVLHRDVKPANVLLTPEGEPLLADFNISSAKFEGTVPAALFGGSLAYMAPEHLEAFDTANPRSPESLDGRVDLFALAITLWELLTGERPFDRGPLLPGVHWTLEDLVAERKAGLKPEMIAALLDGDVPGLKDAIVRCLAFEPTERPVTAGELAGELELCLRPATRALIRPAPGGWRDVVKRHPLLAIYLPTVGISLLATLFNIEYNEAEIVAHWPKAEAPFRVITPLVNGFLFPLGMALLAWAAWPVIRAVRGTLQGHATLPSDLPQLRSRTLRLGEITAGVCVGCWLAGGLMWPALLRAAAGPPPEGPGAYVHFIISLAVCGLIAGAYPYFLVNFLAVRVFYPSLLGRVGPASADAPALRRSEQALGRYRAAAAAVPLLAVALLAYRGSSSTFAVAVLGLAGALGVALAYFIEGQIRDDLANLTSTPSAEL